jgi:hypothetical protein
VGGEEGGGGGGPGVEGGGGEGAAGGGGEEGVEEVLGVGFDARDARGGEEGVEVGVELGDGRGVDDGHGVAEGHLVWGGGLAGDEGGGVAAGEAARGGGGQASPVAEEGMPDGDVLDVFVGGADFRDEALEARGEGVGLGFEVFPTVLPLGGTAGVDVLPAVVDDQGGDVDAAGG